MSEEAIKAEFDEPKSENPDDNPPADPPADPPKDTPEDPPPDPPEDPPEPEYSEAETKARSAGWRPKEEWEGDEEEWLPAGQFNRFGSVFDALKESRSRNASLEQAGRDQLATNNQFHQQQTQILESQITELKSERTKAIDLADVEEADRIQGEIDDLSESVTASKAAITAVPAATSAEHPGITAWNEANTWAKDATPKAAFAKSEFERILEEDYTDGCDMNDLITASLPKVDASIAKAFPQNNSNRNAPAANIRGRATHRQTNTQLSMNDLTADEKALHEEFGDTYKDDKSFLTAVKNAREGV